MIFSSDSSADVDDYWFIGIVLTSALCGISTLQTFNYFCRYTKDQFRKKVSVLAAWIFGACHAVICIKLFRRYITGDLLDNRLEMEWKWKSNAVLCVRTPIPSNLISTPLPFPLVLIAGLQAASVLAIETFYCVWIWKFTWIRGNWLVPAVVTAAILIGNAFSIVAIVKIFLDAQKEPSWTTYTALGTGVMKSTLISLVMVWYLHKRPAGFFHSRYVPVRIFRYIIASGFLPASFVISLVVCFCVLASGNLSFLLSNLTVQLYVTSYLALLNIRSSRPSQYVESTVSSPESTFCECESNVLGPQTPPLVHTSPVPHPASMCTRTSSQFVSLGHSPSNGHRHGRSRSYSTASRRASAQDAEDFEIYYDAPSRLGFNRNSTYQGDGPFTIARTNV